MALSRADLLKQLVPHLDKLFNVHSGLLDFTEYRMKSSYGKYSIYRWDVKDYERTSTTLAKGLSYEEASSMMKLLKEMK